MNVNSLIASLLPSAPSSSTAAAGASAASPFDASSTGAQFKAQFGQAVATLSALAANADGNGATTSTSSASAAGGSTASTTADTLQAALQKKIDDLLAAGTSVQDIVQQLAAALATALAGQFGGNPAQIQTQLQTAFASALSPPGNGPPISSGDLASTLAQRFRQIADLAAGVIGETGQSNRLFAGSFSDAAITAGGRPAPDTTNGTTAASTVTAALAAATPTLTAPQGDGKTVATTAPLTGSNGDTLLGRLLARAANASATANASAPSPSAFGAAPAADAGRSAAAPAIAGLADRAVAAAVALLAPSIPSVPAGPVSAPVAAPAPDVLASGASSIVATATSADLQAGTTPGVSGAVTAFVKAFTDALATTSGAAAPDRVKALADDSSTALPTIVTSSQAPTIGAFAPVGQAVHVDAIGTDPTSGTPTPASPVPDTSVIEQVLRGAFLSTTGPVSSVRLKLVPEDLGDVTVRLNINGSSVTAQVLAQTPAAHDALVAGANQLSRALADAGLKLDSFNVSLAGGFSSFQQQQQQSSAQQQTASGRPLLLGDVDTTESDDPSLLAIPSFGPSTTVTGSWGPYNYLV